MSTTPASIVVGRGPVGTVLAHRLSHVGPTWIVARSHEGTPAHVEDPELRDFRVPVLTWSSAVPAPSPRVYLCVGPQDAPGALGSLGAWLSGGHLVLCGNGLASAPPWAASRPGLGISRALFYWAAAWTSGPRGKAARFLGGSRIVVGSLRGETPRDLFPPPFVPEATATVGLAEREKLFVNLCLALWIGPRMLPNGHLPQVLPEDTLRRLAQACSGPLSLGAERLITSLTETAQETACNVNSVSRRWAQGDPRGVLELLRGLPGPLASLFGPQYHLWPPPGPST